MSEVRAVIRGGLDFFRDESPVILGCLRVPAEAAYVGTARRFTLRVLALYGVDEADCEAAESIVSELVANVVVHDDWDDDPAALVAIERRGSALRLEVHDSDSYMGEVRPADAESESGRGLAIVAALSDRWGVEETPEGKCVWAELDVWPDLRSGPDA